MNIFRKLRRLSSKKKRVLIVVICLLVLLGIAAVSAMQPSSDTSLSSSVSTEKTYNTTQPQKLNDESVVLVGKVLSHESASIFPRRSGIVEDILVDIGDPVQKGQIIARLLPEGVENVSGLEILVQQNVAQRALDEYNNTIAVTTEEIKTMEQILAEKELALERLRVDEYREGYEEGNDALRVLNTQLNERIELQEVLLRDAATKIEQAKDTLYTAMQHAHQTAMLVMAGGNSYTRLSLTSTLRTDHVDKTLGSTDYGLLNETVRLINSFRESLNDFSGPDNATDAEFLMLTDSAEQVLDSVEALLNASGAADPTLINTLLTSTHSTQGVLFSARNGLQNANESYDSLFVKEREAIAVLREQIEKQGTEVESNILLMESDIAQYRQEIEYAIARADQRVDTSKNNYSIAQSTYQQTAAEKGHTSIYAPFSGIISRRNINVGELAMTSQSIFDLIEVETTLSQMAKNEIQFGLPEDLQQVLDVGQEIEFYLPEAELSSYTAEVTRISPQVDEMLHTVTVQAKIPDELRLAHHTSVQVRVITGKKETYLIDSSAVKREDERNFVWVQSGEEIEQIFLDVLHEDGEFAEVAGEITEDTEVLLNYYGTR
jgi:multidrug efflux pump subunit AcrA (membrane-fusion protein)